MNAISRGSLSETGRRAQARKKRMQDRNLPLSRDGLVGVGQASTSWLRE